jgi:hypothetical protein
MLLSGLSNIVLVACFVVALSGKDIYRYLRSEFYPSTTKITHSQDPLAVARLSRTDNEILTRGVQSTLKKPLAMTSIPLRMLAEPGDQYASDDPSVQQASYDNGPSALDEQGMRVSPVLRKDPRTGQLTIGNFKSMTMVGNSTECLNLGYSMLGDTGTSNNMLQVLTDTDEITIARICANNGSVIISCRNEQITVSPRQSRPDDKCSRPEVARR